MSRRAKRTAETAQAATGEPAGPEGMPMQADAEKAAGAELSQEERDAITRAELHAMLEAKRERAKHRPPGSWCRVTGSRARCDNPDCKVRGRGSLRVYRVATSEHRYDHRESVGPGGGVVHNMTQSTLSECTLLCEKCKFRQMVQQHGLDDMLDDDNQLPPMAEVIQLTGVQLDPERYEALRITAMVERANPTEPVVVPAIERRWARERRALRADDIEASAAGAIG